jgi:hypothetical protein
VTALDARTHHDVSIVDTWKPHLEDDDPDQGYQREVVTAHAKRIARFLLDPDAVGILAIRYPLFLVYGQHRDAAQRDPRRAVGGQDQAAQRRRRHREPALDDRVPQSPSSTASSRDRTPTPSPRRSPTTGPRCAT